MVAVGLLFVTTGALNGCAVVNSSQVDQSTVHQGYEARYESGENKLHLEARFYVGGSTGTMLLLDGTSQVAAEGQKMNQTTSIFNEVIYARVLGSPGDLNRAFTFVYTNNDGRNFANVIRLPRGIAFGTGAGQSARLGSGHSFRWEAADAVQSGERLTLTVWSSQAMLMRDDSRGGMTGEILLSAGDVTSLGAGMARAKLCRENRSTLSDATDRGGSLEASYCTGEQKFTVQ